MAADQELTTADGPMRLYEAVPEGEPRGAVIVIQEAFGVNPHIEDVTRRVAAAGYHAVAPDMFHRTGPGAVVDYGDFGSVMEHFVGVGSDAAILADVDATIDYLHGIGFADGQIGIVGFCFGGRVTFLVASQRAIGAGVGFYGGGIVTARFPQFPALVDGAQTMKTPWLGLFGDRDESIPVDDVELLRKALTDAPVDAEVVRYADAEHGFHCDARPSYNAGAAADGWSGTLDWFGRHLGAR
jgi:carboxymethylenebutenolidase